MFAEELESFEIEVLRTLFQRKGWCDSYYFHKRYKLSPAQISFVINKYGDAGLIIAERGKIRLSDKGRAWVLKQRKQIFLQPRANRWQQPLDENVLDPNDLYPAEIFDNYPDMSKIKLRFFERQS